MIPKYFPQYIKDRIEHWDDERNIDNGIIVTLKHGWSFEYNEHQGVHGFNTITKAKEGVIDAHICHCDQCKKERLTKPYGASHIPSRDDYFRY